MSLPESPPAPIRLDDLPKLPVDSAGPVFAEPWQAQAFALAVRLAEQGCFSWTEWVSAFSADLKAAAERGEPDDSTRYYEHWLTTLERLAIQKALTDRVALDKRKAAWIDAYLHTPHGQPVDLANGDP